MTGYRAYALDPQGQIVRRFDFEAADDSAALTHARQWVNGCDIEVRQHERVVAKLTQPADPLRPETALKLPICPACGDEMRVTTIEPHMRFRNLDIRSFQCACGMTTSDVVARAE